MRTRLLRRSGNASGPSSAQSLAWRRMVARWWPLGLLALIVAAGLAALLLRPPPEAIPHTVGVMPFIDLTDAVQRDPFAGTVTEAVIARLGKVPGLGVSPPTASMMYRGKPVAFGEFATALQVAYVVDGSMRKARGTVTVAARLTRAG
ncbi:hypothetical protein LP419_02335 [Massilia sp. H-1]|nr:hypothetical protein LP419_02335 [Massilia sp. H-1]